MLGITVSNIGHIITLYLRGKIVIGKTGILRKVVEAQVKPCVIVLDLARVTAIDAHGLGVLLELRQHAESSGIEFRLLNVSRLVGRVLEITRLNSVFDIGTEGEVLPAPATRASTLRGLSSCAYTINNSAKMLYPSTLCRRA